MAKKSESGEKKSTAGSKRKKLYVGGAFAAKRIKVEPVTCKGTKVRTFKYQNGRT